MKNILKNRRKWVILGIFALIVIALAVWIVCDNYALTVTEYTVENDKLPSSFDGYTVVQVSDLHNAAFGKDNERLLALIEEQSPDLIALTGDLLDASHTDADAAVAFAERAAAIAPTYMVTGNHEGALDDWDAIRTRLVEVGVVMLEGSSVELTSEDGAILLSGLNDPTLLPDESLADLPATISGTIDSLAPEDERFHLLLSHRPELFDSYADSSVDLVLTGHAHGGMFRLPFIGGIYAPGQGLFPEYTEGIFDENGTTMIVSRGLGNSSVSFRIGNRPEVVVVKLKKG